MKFHYKIILFIFIIGIFVMPILSIYAVEIIPCGTSTTSPCTACDLYKLVGNVINFLLLSIIVPLAGLSLAWGGIKFMLSGGNEGEVTKAKEIITNTIWGIIIALSAWLIVNTAFSLLIDSTSFPWPWQEFPTCPSIGTGSATG